MSRESADRYIRASEVGQYAFCPRAWWLGVVEGLPSAHQEEMKAGEAAHRAHGRRARLALFLTRVAYALLMLALLIGILLLLLSMTS